MKAKQEGIMLANVAIAIFAGALSSVLILIFTHGYSVSEAISEPGRALAGRHSVPAGDAADQSVEINDSSSMSGADLGAEIEQLQASMSAASEERSQLTTTIVMLKSQIATLESELVNLDSRFQNDTGSADALAEFEAIHSADGLADNIGEARESPAERQFESLLAAGVDEQSARDLQRRGDQYQLARLELFDQATREGWADSDQLDERLEALDENWPDLRSELGDGAFDRYLYESGRPNRVEIASIISGSAADQAGLVAGDVVSSYAEERIYSVQDLQSSTRTGTRGEYVQLLVERDGEIQRTDIPRGPLGVTLQSIRKQP